MRTKPGTFLTFLCLLAALPAIGCASTPTRESTGEYVDDSVITAKVKAELAADKVTSVFRIGVETYKGIVQLSGFVDTKEQSEEAETVAKRVQGVKEVRNSLILKPK